MKRLNINIHILPDELLEVVKQWGCDQQPFIVLMRHFPQFQYRVTDSANFNEISSGFRNIDRIVIGFKPPALPPVDAHDFQTMNSDWFVISLGGLDDKGLKESNLSVKTDNLDEFAKWKTLHKQVAKISKAGLWGINPNSGKFHYYPSNRYTMAALEEVRNTGRKLLPVAGWNYYQPENPQT